MSNTKGTKKERLSYAPGSKDMEAFLQAGYPDMTKEKAEQIIKEREARPELWPYEQYERAKAFLAALNSRATVTSTRQPWVRKPKRSG